jgi:hypothetical protein
MKLTLTPELRIAAQRCVWFETPEEAIRYPERLIAYILTYGSMDDVRALRVQMDDDALKSTLDRAPPGVFDIRSWAYWNLLVGRDEAPPLPQRSFARLRMSAPAGLDEHVERDRSSLGDADL